MKVEPLIFLPDTDEEEPIEIKFKWVRDRENKESISKSKNIKD